MSLIVDILILAGVLLAIVAAWTSRRRRSARCIAGSASTARGRARWPTALNC